MGTAKCANACYAPQKKFYICGVWWDGNELARLLRIQKCRKAERSVSIVDAVSPSVPENATNRVTFLSVMGNTERENAEVKDW